MTFPILELVNKPFYFGIGGIGDFLLLMSTFYDDINDNDVDVIFVCNNTTVIRELVKQFPNVNKFWLHPNQAFPKCPEMWDMIKSHPLCMGTGVTPKNFDYIKDWCECGKSNVFDYYGVKRQTLWMPLALSEEKTVCIQPFGGADDKTKIKEIPKYIVEQLIDEYVMNGSTVYLIGSKKDEEKLGVLDTSMVWDEDGGWLHSFDESFKAIRSTWQFIGADSWGKTLAAFAGAPVKIYPNVYTKPLKEMFGMDKDPGNYVFLDNWGFDYFKV